MTRKPKRTIRTLPQPRVGPSVEFMPSDPMEDAGQTEDRRAWGPLKVCPRCGEEKERSATCWRKDPRRPDGLKTPCRDCDNDSSLAARNRRKAADPAYVERIREQDRLRKRALPDETKATIYERRRDQYRDDPEFRERMKRAAIAAYRNKGEREWKPVA